MELVERLTSSMGGMLKALQGEPTTPKMETAKGELAGALAELEARAAKDREEDEDAS